MLIGLTGGIACGKSTVAQILVDEHGFHSIDTDQLIHELLAEDKSVYEAILGRFGRGVLNAQGGIERPALAKIVFKSRDELDWLEKLLHPMVKARVRELIEGYPLGKWVVQHPLIFEIAAEKEFDFTVCVAASREVQTNRLKQLGSSFEQVEERMARQLPLESKMQSADFVLLNNSSLNSLKEQVVLLVLELLGKG